MSATGISCVEAREAANHPDAQAASTMKNYPAKSVSGAEAEKPALPESPLKFSG